MSLISKPYSQVRSEMQAGDVIAFGGTSPFSELIKFSTRSAVSHVAVVFQSQMRGENSPRFLNQVIESGTFNQKSGVMINRLSDRLASYDGNIWWLPLGERARSTMENFQQVFFDFLLKQEHKPYDLPQALMSAVDTSLPLLSGACTNKEDFAEFFCSELVAAALEKAQVLPEVNASEITPIDLCRFSLYDTHYVQLKGERKSISGFNQICPRKWQD